MAADNPQGDIAGMNYERAFQELESIVTRLERSDVPLEDSIAMFERGQALRSRCDTLLRQAEAKVEKLTLDSNGAPTGTAPLGD